MAGSGGWFEQRHGWHWLPRHAMPSCEMPCCAAPCRAMPHHAIPCCTQAPCLPCHAVWAPQALPARSQPITPIMPRAAHLSSAYCGPARPPMRSIVSAYRRVSSVCMDMACVRWQRGDWQGMCCSGAGRSCSTRAATVHGLPRDGSGGARQPPPTIAAAGAPGQHPHRHRRSKALAAPPRSSPA